MAPEEAEEAGEPMEMEEELPPASAVKSIEFTHDKKRLKLLIKGDGVMKPSVFSLEGRIVVDIPGVSMKASIPDNLVYPIKALRYGKYEGKLRLVMDLEDKVKFAASTEGDTVAIAIPLSRRVIKKAAEAEEAPAEVEAAGEAAEEEEAAVEEGAPPVEAKKYTGKLISLDFQDADIVPIFRFLGDIAGYNVVIHPDVKGTITLKLLNVPWDQALDIILELSNLGKSMEGNILRVAPTAVFTRQKEEEARLKSAETKVAPLVQETIHLEHIGVADFQTRLEEAKVLSPRGTIRLDERTNTIIINDTEESLDKIVQEEVPYWDTEEHGTMQVLIEAKIVEVNTQYSRQLGIRWGGSATDNNFSFVNFDSSYDFSVNTPVVPAGPDATAQGGILAIGYTDTFTMNMSLEALESVGETRKLANPRILTIDKQAATINQGVQIPYATSSADGPKTELKNATLSLNVTPEIQPNDILRLVVKVTNDTPQQVGGETGINTQSINTQALVKEGQTLVLGGIYTNQTTESETRVPLLGRIPLLGWLFKTKSVTRQPTELLIFITPRIVR